MPKPSLDRKDRSRAFVCLGKALEEALQGKGPCSGQIEEGIIQAGRENSWFTAENVNTALKAIVCNLKEDKLHAWLKPYRDELNAQQHPKRVAVVMAGNIPCAGFHDFICTLMAGHIFLGHTSSSDKVLLPILAEMLIQQEPRFAGRLEFRQGKPSGFDAAIASGSDNTGRYFDYHFGRCRHIIRRHRNSVAILTGRETEEELILLGRDIFLYFGLGCRSVSKLFVPQAYDFMPLLNALSSFSKIAKHSEHSSNYTYNKAVFSLNDVPFLDNDFLLLRESTDLHSPISTLHYEFYNRDVHSQIEKHGKEIQCVVSEKDVPFGESQFPALNDYADNVDTMRFLLHLK
ncbi:MAG: acyl-CoA reductase [Flavobacteriales bacterium]